MSFNNFFGSVLSKIIASVLLSVGTLILIRLKKWNIPVPISKTNRKKSLLYLSEGGTCRDPMAKVITEQVLKNTKLKYKLEVKGVGLLAISSPEVSFAAKHAINDIYGENLLRNHKTGRISKEIIDNADLILVMSHALLDQLKSRHTTMASGKTYVFKEFFGLKGDIEDPYPDGKSNEVLLRYKECALEIKEVLEENIDTLVKVIDT